MTVTPDLASKHNRLSFQRMLALSTWIQQPKITARARHKPDPMLAEEATAAVGFTVTLANIKWARHQHGITKAVTDDRTSDASTNIDARVTTLEATTKSIQGTLDAVLAQLRALAPTNQPPLSFGQD